MLLADGDVRRGKLHRLGRQQFYIYRLYFAENLLRKGLEGCEADAATRRPERGRAEPRKARFPALCAGNAPKLLKQTF
jgi:hypothetical protein